METINAHLGEATALLTAIIWALAVIMFKKSGEEVHPVGLNLFKVIMAGVLLVPTALLFGENLLRPAPIEDYLLLLLSGVLGIGIADTLFFKSLNALGAGLSAIVDCLYSPFCHWAFDFLDRRVADFHSGDWGGDDRLGCLDR